MFRVMKAKNAEPLEINGIRLGPGDTGDQDTTVMGEGILNGAIKGGATAEEIERELPGDELVLNPRWGYTHAVTVQAEPAEVWPWLAQIGQGRGGFYTYELLENLVPSRKHLADERIARSPQRSSQLGLGHGWKDRVGPARASRTDHERCSLPREAISRSCSGTPS